ncbi:MAG: hypothetical protein L0221_12445, partial [Chloroflexi bacterium]|nr:hypothetical protein [Chloroflexota bacterium]
MSTTQDHDLLAEVARSVPDHIAGAFWVAGRVPNHVTAPPALAGTPFANLEIFTIQPPSVDIVADPQSGGLLGIYRQPMIIRDDTIAGEIANTIEIRLPIALVERVVDGVSMQVLELDLTEADIDNTVLTSAADAIAEAVVIAFLAATGSTEVALPVTPPLLPEVRFFPVVGTSPLALKVYANVDGRDPGPMTATPALHAPPWLPDRPPHPGLAAVIDGELFLDQVHQELIERNIVAGQIVVDGINERILNLAVDGEITWDPDLDFPLFPEDGITLPFKFDLSPTLERIRLTQDLTVELVLGAIRVSGSIEAI